MEPSGPSLPPPFNRYRQELEKTLRCLLAQGSPDGRSLTAQAPPLLYRMMRYHLGWEDPQGNPLPESAGGKALRPTLCLLACQAVGGPWPQALPAAAALELVHNFSLVHDDIQDQDRERRHRPTVWAIWGQPQAINAGDSLLALAQLAVLQLAESAVPAAKVTQAARLLNQHTLEIVEGQSLDLSFETSLTIDLNTYLEMISKKTGALFDCSLRLGALVGSDDPQVVEAFGRCGRLLGIAFQVRDDMLGVWGSTDQTGKPLAADIRRKKKSLPIVYGLSAQGAEREQLVTIYSKPELSQEDVSAVLKALEALGAPEYCRHLALAKKGEALAQLDNLALEPTAHRELKEIADFLLERQF